MQAKETITILLDQPPHEAQLQAEVTGHVAIHRSYGDDYWVLTHVPTGLMMWWAFDRATVEQARSLFLAAPIDLSVATKEQLKLYAKQIGAVVRQIRHWRKDQARRMVVRSSRKCRRNRANIRRVQAFRKNVKDKIFADMPYILWTLTDWWLDQSENYRFSRGPRRLWRERNPEGSHA